MSGRPFLCVECRHHKARRPPQPVPGVWHVCLRPVGAARVSPVTGEDEIPGSAFDCDAERSPITWLHRLFRWRVDRCGPEGRWFERAPSPPATAQPPPKARVEKAKHYEIPSGPAERGDAFPERVSSAGVPAGPGRTGTDGCG